MIYVCVYLTISQAGELCATSQKPINSVNHSLKSKIAKGNYIKGRKITTMEFLHTKVFKCWCHALYLLHKYDKNNFISENMTMIIKE